ncbi:MAG: amino acid ABC transporter permease [Desulfamplus sp.]|nr:amino acid ABC transporter permease [Desulfamplus sp.]
MVPLLQIALMAALAAWFFSGAAAQSNYNWQWYRIPPYLGFFDESGFFVWGSLLKGLGTTLAISSVSLFASCLIGLVTALCRLSSSFSLMALARVYLELVRNTPLIVQIFFIYFVIAPAVGFDRFTAAVIALSLFEGAYASEIIRAGIVNVSSHQWEAAESIGLGKFLIYRHIVLPQAVPVIIPPLAGQMISLVKDSALVSTIALYDLTMEGQIIIAETYMVFEVWLTVAAIYIILTSGLSIITHLLEKKFSNRYKN